MKPVYSKPNFGKPPEGYIPGLGRGAIGFITRSDLGPARNQQGSQPAPSIQNQSDFSQTMYDSWTGYGGSLFANAPNDADDRQASQIYQKINNYMDGRRQKQRQKQMKSELDKIKKSRPGIINQFKDISTDLSSVSTLEWECLPEASNIVGKSRNKKRDYNRFTPLPDNIIEDAWKDGQLKSTVRQQSQSGLESQIPKIGQTRKFSQTNGNQTSLTDLIAHRGKKLADAFDKMSQSSDSGYKTPQVNKQGYMTQLDNLKINTETQINFELFSDVRKARLLMKSLRQSGHNTHQGWLGGARIEQLDGKLSAARELLAEACQLFPTHDSIFLQSARLAPNNQKALRILCRGVKQNPKSIKLWQAWHLRQEIPQRKQKILRLALQQCPQSLILWKQAIEQTRQDKIQAKKLLRKAVQCVPAPDSLQLWLALAKQESYQEAKRVINKARQSLPNQPIIWIHGAMLEEAQWQSKITSQQSSSSNICRQNIQSILKLACDFFLIQRGFWIKSQQWLKEAWNCEQGGSVITAQAIIKVMYPTIAKLSLKAQNEDIKEKNQANCNESSEEIIKKFIQQANDSFQSAGCYYCARQIMSTLINLFPLSRPVWQNAVNLQHRYQPNREDSSADRELQILQKACKSMKDDIEFRLRLAKHLWRGMNRIKEAQKTLIQAMSDFQRNQTVLLALVKFQRENLNYVKAFKLLEEGRKQLPNSIRIWLQSIQTLRQQKMYERANLLANQAIQALSNKQNILGGNTILWKIYLVRVHIMRESQSQELLQKTKSIQECYQATLNKFKKVPQVWTDYANWLISMEQEVQQTNQKLEDDLEQADPKFTKKLQNLGQQSYLIKVRTLLYKARVELPFNQDIWLLSIKLQEAAENTQIAKSLISKAKQQCSTQQQYSGKLIAQQIKMQKTLADKKRKAALFDDQQKSSPYVMAELAKIFWAESKYEKVEKYLKLALYSSKQGSQIGDIWALLYNFIQRVGSQNNGTKLHQDDQKSELDSEIFQMKDQNTLQSLERKVNNIRIRRGDHWCKQSKKVQNWHKSNFAILKKVAQQIEQVQ